MPTINGKACVANGTPVDKVFSDGKQVYGRNLLRNSNFSVGDNYANFSNSTGGIITVDNMTALKIDAKGAVGKNAGIFILAINPPTSQIPQPCSYQIKIKSEVDGITAYLGYQGSLTTNCKEIILTTKWQTFKVNGELFTNGNFAFRIYVYSAATIYVTNCKLEQSNVATPWTPAPEDVM